MPYGSKLHISFTNYHLLAAQEEPYQKAYFLEKNVGGFSEENKVRRLDLQRKNDKTKKSKTNVRQKRERR